MSLIPGWDTDRRSGEFARSPGTLSASPSLNAAIMAKKETERRAAADKAAAAVARAALNKPVEEADNHHGWWAAVDSCAFNNDVHVPERKLGTMASVPSQFAMAYGPALATAASVPLATASAPISKPSVKASGLAAIVAAALPASHSVPQPPEASTADGWWAQMDTGALNRDDATVDRTAHQAFTPQFVGNSGLVNRLMPMGSAH